MLLRAGSSDYSTITCLLLFFTQTWGISIQGHALCKQGRSGGHMSALCLSKWVWEKGSGHLYQWLSFAFILQDRLLKWCFAVIMLTPTMAEPAHLMTHSSPSVTEHWHFNPARTKSVMVIMAVLLSAWLICLTLIGGSLFVRKWKMLWVKLLKNNNLKVMLLKQMLFIQHVWP